MDYEKLINDNGMYLYRDDSFNTESVSLCFQAENGNRENAVYDLICDYLLKANKKYDRNAVYRKSKELYDIGLDAVTGMIGSKRMFYLTIDMVSPTVVEDDYSKDAFEFSKEMLLHPDFTRQDVLDTIRKERIALIRAAHSNPSVVARDLYYTNVLPDPNLEYEYTPDMEYTEKLLNSITLEEMKKLYEKTVSDDRFFRGIMFGNTNIKEFKEFRENFPFKSKIDTIDYSNKQDPVEGVKIFATDSAKQSTVYITYTIDGVDETVKSVLSDILSGSSYLCNEILRQKYKLVYSSGVMLHVYGGLFIVKANIDKDNLEKMVEATDEMVSIIQDPEKLKPLLEKAKESIKEADYVMSERSDRMLYELSAYIRNMNVGQNYKELIDNIDNVKPEDITKATKTLKKKNVFMFRGDAK